jgi:hypothetical protein
MNSIIEKLMRTVNSVFSMIRQTSKNDFFHIFVWNHHKLYIKNSIILIEKCSRRNGKMMIPDGKVVDSDRRPAGEE